MYYFRTFTVADLVGYAVKNYNSVTIGAGCATDLTKSL